MAQSIKDQAINFLPDGDMLDTLSIVIADITAMVGLVCVVVANGGAGGFVVSFHGVFIYTAY